MNTELILPDKSELATASTSELKADLGKAIGLTARAITYVAVIWAELTRRGEDLSEYKFALADYMLSVADGRLLPEAVAQLAGRLRTLEAVAQLPVERQKYLVEGGTVEVLKPDGAVTPRTLDSLTFTEVARVIRAGSILTPAEQKLSLQRTRNQVVRRRQAGAGRPPRIAVDREAGTIHIGKSAVPMEKILIALRGAGYQIADPV